MTERFKLRRKRIGSSSAHQPANRVNKFLSQAIEARSVDQEKANHVNMFSLCFRDPEKERQVRIKWFFFTISAIQPKFHCTKRPIGVLEGFLDRAESLRF